MTAPTKQQIEFLRFEALKAARDPKFMDAISKAFDTAIDTPDSEARIWFDNAGEFVLARDVLISVFKGREIEGVTLKEIRRDEMKLTLSFELSNGSAVVLGLKVFRAKTVMDDILKRFFQF